MYKNLKDEALDGALENYIWKRLWICRKTRDDDDDDDDDHDHDNHLHTPLLPLDTFILEVSAW
jgi:hypothetical protein